LSTARIGSAKNIPETPNCTTYNNSDNRYKGVYFLLLNLQS
jgi:hypothetical protein